MTQKNADVAKFIHNKLFHRSHCFPRDMLIPLRPYVDTEQD